MRKLKVGEHYFNYQVQTATEGEMSLADRLMWGRMRMNPRDISDVTGSTYTFLINGHGPADDLKLLFRPGERVRLRVINGSAMTFFNLANPRLRTAGDAGRRAGRGAGAGGRVPDRHRGNL